MRKKHNPVDKNELFNLPPDTRASRNKKSHTDAKKRRRRLFWIILSVLFISVLAYGAHVLLSFQNAFNKTNHTVQTENLRTTKLSNDDPFSILLIGIDQGAEYGHTGDARADTLIVVTLNPKSNELTLFSVPRDMMVPIKTAMYTGHDKINHSYAYGGIEGTINTIQNYLQVPIDEYVQIDIDGLMELVTALGGVKVVSPLTFEHEGYAFVEGQETLIMGTGANIFARMRYLDPEGTTGRENRQRILIKAIAQKLMSPELFIRYQSIFDTVSNNVKTSFTLNRLLDMKDSYGSVLNNIQQDHFEKIGVDINGGYYDLITDKEHLRISNAIRQKLQLNPITQADLEKLGLSASQIQPVFQLYNSNEFIDANGNPVAAEEGYSISQQTYQNQQNYQTYQQTTTPFYTEQSSSQPLVETTATSTEPFISQPESSTDSDNP